MWKQQCSTSFVCVYILPLKILMSDINSFSATSTEKLKALTAKSLVHTVYDGNNTDIGLTSWCGYILIYPLDSFCTYMICGLT